MSDIITLTDEEWKLLKKLIQDYERSTAVGRLLWKLALVVSGFLVGLATFLAGVSNFLHNMKAHP